MRSGKLLAWGAAAIPSPILIARVHQNTGSYGPAIHAIAVIMVFALALPILARYRPRAPQAATVHELRKTA